MKSCVESNMKDGKSDRAMKFDGRIAHMAMAVLLAMIIIVYSGCSCDANTGSKGSASTSNSESSTVDEGQQNNGEKPPANETETQEDNGAAGSSERPKEPDKAEIMKKYNISEDFYDYVLNVYHSLEETTLAYGGTLPPFDDFVYSTTQEGQYDEHLTYADDKIAIIDGVEYSVHNLPEGWFYGEVPHGSGNWIVGIIP